MALRRSAVRSRLAPPYRNPGPAMGRGFLFNREANSRDNKCVRRPSGPGGHPLKNWQSQTTVLKIYLYYDYFDLFRVTLSRHSRNSLETGRKKMKLKDTKVLWDNGGPVKVIPKDTRESEADRKLNCSSGATDLEWVEASDAERLTMLLRLFVRIATIYKVAPKDIHEAFWQVDEYREYMGEEMKTL